MQSPEDLTLLVWWMKALLYSCFAALGGVLGHVMRALDRKESITWTRAAVEGVAAGFVGMLMLMLCGALHLPEQWTGITVGLSGWLGAQASIRILERAVYNKLGLKRREEDDAPPAA